MFDVRKLFQLEGKRQIYRVLISHTARSIAFSFVGIYIPIYFLTLGYALSEVIIYYMLLHGIGLLLALTIIPKLIQRWGLIAMFKLNYIFEIAHLALLFLLPMLPIPIYALAPIAGTALFFYWVPLNILLIKNADFDKMGTDLAKFFALPKFFGIFGPLIGAGLVYFIGFWPTFLIAMIGILLSYLPLTGLTTENIRVTFHWREAWQGLKRRRRLFWLEGLDNVMEESEWFWGIYVFLIIGSLAAPGIAGAAAAVGASLFTLLIGKRVNRSPRRVVVLASLGLALIFCGQFFVSSPFQAYMISLFASFILSAFLVAFTSVIYREVKGDEEEEFIILREIPTVLGRMVVFAGILVCATNPGNYFLIPMIVALLLSLGFALNGRLGIHLQHS